MKKLMRNDPCWCGSKKPYCECHMDFDKKIEMYRKKFHKVPPRSIIKNEEQLQGMRESSKINIAEIYVVESNAMQRGFKELRISEQALAVEMIYKRLKNSEAVRAIEKELSVLEGVKSPMDTCNDSNENEVKSPVDTCEKVDNLKGAAEEYGLSRASIARLLRINKLSDELKAMVESQITLRTQGRHGLPNSR